MGGIIGPKGDIMKVYFTEKQVADSGSFSPSASKPAQVVEAWLTAGFDIEIVRPGPVTRADFCLAHDAAYVKGVLSCTKNNGFGNNSREVADSLTYTTGSLVAAAKSAFKSGTVTVSPTSGFHHAGYGNGGGFCTFNGLIVAAQKLKNETTCGKVGILDLDNHFGNGTEDIIKKLKLDYIEHFSGGASYHKPKQAEPFLSMLPEMLRDKFRHCDIVIFQAGADPHIDDPLGGWLTTEQMAERDRIVFEVMKEMGIPVVWNLAGGYQVEDDGSIPKVLELHSNTMRICLEVHAKEEDKVA